MGFSVPNPFGLKFGETPDSKIAEYDIRFYSVPDPHPDFKNYCGKWDPVLGLTSISCTSMIFEKDRFGENSIALYNRIRSQLATKYGQYSESEILFVNSKFNNLKDFVRSILECDRSHSSRWAEQFESILDCEIKEINLEILADGADRSWVKLTYNFVDDEDRGPGEDIGVSSL
ncbi:hypothetical protein MKK63_16985 [Methylobacterium sp. J-088]|uniref:hypothetical protein n=1 Tax=Methylobacterium sp. J-088 TaxID=2836664 RepID=UPI001FB9E789|nr:hypothetical protein [Methylobacterium sp. J-088]MCJ2064397.1 hypothetical protein [Methylobacterium sp. J-088]